MNLLFALNKKAENSNEFFLLKTEFARSTRDELPVVPCHEAFLHNDSQGTKAWRKLNPNTKFRGCFEAERSISAADQLSSRPTESFGRRYDIGEQQALTERWSDKKDLEYDDLFSARTDGMREAFTFKSLNQFIDETERELRLGFDPAPSQTVGLIKRIQQRLREEYHRRRPSKRFMAAIKLLTVRQRKAARLVYLENHEQLTKVQIAAKLGISIDSLKERLAAVKTKVHSVYPEFAIVGALQNAEESKEKFHQAAINERRDFEKRSARLKPCRYTRGSQGIDLTYLCRPQDPHRKGHRLFHLRRTRVAGAHPFGVHLRGYFFASVGNLSVYLWRGSGDQRTRRVLKVKTSIVALRYKSLVFDPGSARNSWQ